MDEGRGIPVCASGLQAGFLLLFTPGVQDNGRRGLQGI